MADDPNTQMRDAARAFAIAMDFFGTVLVLTAVGYGLDWWRKTSPTFTLIGLGLGLLLGFYRFVKEALKMGKK